MLFATDKIPFLITVLLAMLAWTTNQLTLELGKGPTIEISSKQYKEETDSIEYLLTNISSAVAYKDIVFSLKLDSDMCNGSPYIELGSPNMKDIDTKKPRCENKRSARYPVAQFHPDSKLKLVLPVEMEVESKLYVQSNTAVRIINCSVESFIIKNKVTLLTSLFLFWMTLIGLYLLAIKKGWISNEVER